MTNEAIILMNTAELIDKGVIHEENIIHTYQHWHSLGYKVRKGEKAVAKFPIWKYTKRKKQQEDMTEEEAQQQGYCFMKQSAWFTDEQVERIKKGA